MRPERLHEDESHRITLFRGTGGEGRAVVGFEHGRERMQGFDTPACPGYAARLGFDALVVQTARRDWFLSARSTALAGALLRATAGYADVTATGFSMGGYGALLYSAACHARRVMAVSPQYCIDPEVAPFDTERHEKFARIGQPMPRPESQGDTGLAGALLYDPSIRADRAHAALIRAAFPRLTPIALPYGGHPATGVIGGAGGIGRVAAMVAQDRLNPARVRAIHRAARRGAEHYRLNLACAALPRHAARAGDELARLAREASDRIRFEASLALMQAGHAQGAALMSALLDGMAEVPPAWTRKLDRALRAAGV